MPFPIAIRISWRPTYQSINEWHYDPAWPGFSHDCYNFLRSGNARNSYYYGYFPYFINSEPEAINAIRIDDDYEDGDYVNCPRIYWIARDEVSDSLCLVGWYDNAEVLVYGYQDYPRQYERRRPNGDVAHLTWRARARNACLIPQDSRPVLGDILRFGFNQMHLINRIIYLDDNEGDNAREARQEFSQYLGELVENNIFPNATRNMVVNEGRIRRNNERLERYGDTSRLRRQLGYQCACCGFPWGHDENRDVLQRTLEVHHRFPMAELEDGAERAATADDFLLLCARCHRAMHAAAELGQISSLSDVEGLRLLLPPEPPFRR